MGKPILFAVPPPSALSSGTRAAEGEHVVCSRNCSDLRFPGTLRSTAPRFLIDFPPQPQCQAVVRELQFSPWNYPECFSHSFKQIQFRAVSWHKSAEFLWSQWSYASWQQWESEPSAALWIASGCVWKFVSDAFAQKGQEQNRWKLANCPLLKKPKTHRKVMFRTHLGI